MASTTQLTAATLAGAGAAAAGTYGIASYVKLNQIYPTSKPTAFGEPVNVLTFALTGNYRELPDYYLGKILGITKKTNLPYIVKTQELENRYWWEWAFKNKYKYKRGRNKHDIFKNIEIGFSEDVKNTKALNQACEKAYLKERGQFNAYNNPLVLNINTFCSLGIGFVDVTEPRVVSYEKTDSLDGFDNGVFGVSFNKSKLVKIKVEEAEKSSIFNDLWWEWAYKKLLRNHKFGVNAVFHKVTSGYSPLENTKTALNQACKDAYKKSYIDLKANNWQLFNDIKRLCTVYKEKTILVLPEPITRAVLKDSNNYKVLKSLVKKEGNYEKLIDPDQVENENWWEWSFNWRFPLKNQEKKGKLLPPFNNVTQPYSTSSSNALNMACKASYDKLYADLYRDQTGETELFKQIKKFCTSVQKLDLPDK